MGPSKQIDRQWYRVLLTWIFDMLTATGPYSHGGKIPAG